MKKNWTDISVGVHPGVVAQWPGSILKVDTLKSLFCGDNSNERSILMSLHIGTHIDAPEHFLNSAATIDQININKMIGNCFVLNCGDAAEISSEILEKSKIPKKCNKLLLKTTNSSKWSNDFYPNFVGLTLSGAEWIVKNNINFIGNDYLSIQPYKGDYNIHKILLKNEVIILEGINLTNVDEGEYELICLPMKLLNVEAAPARVIIRKINN